jgi:hypothetical protein
MSSSKINMKPRSIYRYKLARAVTIGDVLYLEDEVFQRDSRIPTMKPCRVKMPVALVVTTIEKGENDTLRFLDRDTGRIAEARPDKRLRLMIDNETYHDKKRID